MSQDTRREDAEDRFASSVDQSVYLLHGYGIRLSGSTVEQLNQKILSSRWESHIGRQRMRQESHSGVHILLSIQP
jgi:hypothetical protein